MFVLKTTEQLLKLGTKGPDASMEHFKYTVNCSYYTFLYSNYKAIVTQSEANQC